jgi:hypothetical protein
MIPLECCYCNQSLFCTHDLRLGIESAQAILSLVQFTPMFEMIPLAPR